MNNWENFKLKINELKKNSENQESYKYIEKMIDNITLPEEFERERLIIEEQLRLQTKLQILKLNTEIKYKRDFLISNWINQKISKYFIILESRNITEEDIENIKRYIDTESKKFERNILFNENFRDYVEKNIDIKWNLESIIPQSESIDLFYTMFTKKYTSIVENKLSEKEIYDSINDFSKWLLINEQELEEILKYISKNNNGKLSDFNHIIDIKLSNGNIVSISLNDWKFNEEKPWKIKEKKSWNSEKKPNKEKKIDIIQLGWLQSNWKTSVSEKLVTRLVPEWNFQSYVEAYMSKQRLDDFISLVKNPDLRHQTLTNPFESNPSNKENYIKYVLENWFTDNVNIYINQIIDWLEWKSFTIDWKTTTITKDYIERNRIKIYNNLKILVLNTIHLEWNWRNLKSDISSARWFWQILNTNWYFKSWERSFSSYEVALRNAYKHYGWEISSRKFTQTANKTIPNWIIEEYNKIDSIVNEKWLSSEQRKAKLESIWPNTLSAEQQTIILLAHTFEWWKTYTNEISESKKVSELLCHVATWKWWTWAMFEIYRRYHHTDLDKEKSRLKDEPKKLKLYEARLEEIQKIYGKFLIETT